MMWLFRLAWLNLWRNRNRTLISMAAVFFAVVLSTVFTALSDGAFDNMVKNVVSYYSGYIQIHRAGYWDDQTLENTLATSQAQEDSIRSMPGVVEVVPRLESFSLAASGEITRGVLVVGTDPVREDLATGLKSKLTQGEYFSGQLNEVLLCEGLSKRLNLEVGDTLLLIGQGYHGATAAGKYAVRGLVHYGSPDLNDRMLFMSLQDAQVLYGAEGLITTYVLLLGESVELNSTAAALRASLSDTYEVMTWEEIMPELKQHIDSDTNNAKIFLGFLYVLVTMGIFGTMLMMMIERSYELGMLMAIGMKKLKLIVLLTTESVLTVMAGCVIGMIVSVPIVYYLNIHPIRFTGELAVTYEKFGFEAVLPTSTEPEHFIWQAIVVLCIGLVLSAYPVWRILRLDPVTSMKR
jgi:putative ABC transport system permease protein